MTYSRASLLLAPLLAGGLLLFAPGNSGAGGQHVAYGLRKLQGVSAHVLTVNLREPGVKVSVAVAPGLPGGDEEFASMLRRTRPYAAVNGTFFDKETLRPIGDLVAEGRLLHAGRMGTALAITAEGKAVIRRVEWGRGQDWSLYTTVLGCGPLLLQEGRIDLDPEGERFRDPHVLAASNRSAAGLTPAGKLLLVCVPQPVTLLRLAELMRELGCVDAMNLDGGASMAMYYRGRVVRAPGRRLTNILTVSVPK